MKSLIAILMLLFIGFSMPTYAKGGHYSSGSSHKGAHYKNAATGNHYTKHK